MKHTFQQLQDKVPVEFTPRYHVWESGRANPSNHVAYADAL